MLRDTQDTFGSRSGMDNVGSLSGMDNIRFLIAIVSLNPIFIHSLLKMSLTYHLTCISFHSLEWYLNLYFR
jgi:hypothetical protein